MDLDELLNPVMEKQLVGEDATEEDIFETVQQHRDTEEDDSDGNDHDGNVKPPTRKEALIAASTIQKYIVDINDPFARKLEEVLASFGRHLRLEDSQAMRATQITDYFARK
jgi:hypothetical protein